MIGGLPPYSAKSSGTATDKNFLIFPSSQREQYHQTTEAEETVWTSYTLEH
jgi:hypothetical protein